MSNLTRRGFTIGVIGLTGLAACGNGIGSKGADAIDARVDETLNYLYQNYPGTRDLAARAAGILVMPLLTEVGLGWGGSYGRGALRIAGTTVDYYVLTGASAGIQIGAQQYSHVLFFMTSEALADFRGSTGWTAGADMEYAVSNQADMLRTDTQTALSPVIAVVFGQAGIRIGATLEGAKYTRVIP